MGGKIISMYDGYFCRGMLLLHIKLCRNRMVAHISFLVLSEGSPSDQNLTATMYIYIPSFCSASVLESDVFEEGIDGLNYWTLTFWLLF